MLPVSEKTPLNAAAGEVASQDEGTGQELPRTEASSSSLHAFANQAKCCIGIGSLTLSFVTAKTGLVFSWSGVILLCYLAWEGVRLLVYCAAQVRRDHEQQLKLSKDGKGSKGGSGAGGGSWRGVALATFGDFGWKVTFTVLVLAQLGVATSYVDQAVTTLLKFTPVSVGLQRGMARVIMWLFLSLTTMLVSPGMRAVAIFSSIALLVYLYIYVVLGYYASRTHRATPLQYGFPAENAFLGCMQWYGPAIFAFEGMGTALSIYESMGSTDPQPFLRVMTWSYALALLAYLGISTLGYVAYGDAVTRVVLDSFPSGELLADSTKLVLAIAVTCSYVLQMTPVFQAVEGMMPSGQTLPWLPMRLPALPLVRTALVGITVVLSFMLPSVEQMIAVTGALAFSILCYALPGAFYLKMRPEKTPSPAYETVVAALLVPLGLSCAVLGTYGAIMSPDPNAGGPEAAAAAATRAWAEQAGL
jgi:proton-coupled amino acid transporter